MYVPSLPTTVVQLQNHTTAVEALTQDMFTKVQGEFNFCIDITLCTSREGGGLTLLLFKYLYLIQNLLEFFVVLSFL